MTRRVAPAGVPELISAELPGRSSVLELDARTGRIIDGLARLGHDTTAVDHSDEMLALVKDSKTVLANVSGLDLTFDTVVLATFLINVPDVEMRRDFLAACHRHVVPGGQVFIQRQVPERFALVRPGIRRVQPEKR